MASLDFISQASLSDSARLTRLHVTFTRLCNYVHHICHIYVGYIIIQIYDNHFLHFHVHENCPLLPKEAKKVQRRQEKVNNYEKAWVTGVGYKDIATVLCYYDVSEFICMHVNRAAVRTKSAVSAFPCALGLHAHAHVEWLTRLGSTPRGGGKTRI